MNNSKLIQTLVETIQALNTSPDEKTTNLRKTILEYGSETPDNIDCADRIEIADFKDVERDYQGLLLSDTGISLSMIINSAEGCPVPEQVTAQYPGITQQDWNAALRFCTLLLSSLDKNKLSD